VLPRSAHSCVAKAKADVEARNAGDSTALILAAWSGHLDILKFLVMEAHAQVDGRNNFGNTALIVAAAKVLFVSSEFIL
jgi:ankyrin repeat protein